MALVIVGTDKILGSGPFTLQPLQVGKWEHTRGDVEVEGGGVTGIEGDNNRAEEDEVREKEEDRTCLEL